VTTTPAEPQPLPEEGPATLPGVKAQPAVGELDDDEALGLYVNAVNELVRGLPCADSARGQERWPYRIQLGATMLAARLWRRRDTAGGVEVFGDGGIAYVRRDDPDIAQLLELGDWSKPGVG
jgi:hypothetical protein